MYLQPGDVVEDTDVADPEAELRTAEAAKSLDSASAALRGLVAKVDSDVVEDLCTNSGRKMLEIDDGLRRKDDLMMHSSQMIARIAASSTAAKS